ncbi:Hypothetical protein NTJ_12800 [Nesidiocoris tenuis]|uniref:Uncharacterized protein n=1 Tax=Nesidiocoris tenuis TaxID=355587 RepID=A0ABN7B6V9_9HEMI|nr:Hypothetical protein NTJ_12800 [Nesidiocoris tenuis]
MSLLTIREEQELDEGAREGRRIGGGGRRDRDGNGTSEEAKERRTGPDRWNKTYPLHLIICSFSKSSHPRHILTNTSLEGERHFHKHGHKFLVYAENAEAEKCLF